MEIDLQVLESILSLRKVNHLRNLMSSKAKHHFLSQKQLVSTTKRDIVALAHSLNDRRVAQGATGEGLEEKWMWGEQKLFIWVLIYYVGASLFDTNSMSPQQFQKIIDLFPSKKASFLRYEFVLAFSSDPHAYSQWTPEEVILLERIHSEEREGENRWKKISYQLFRESAGSFFKPAESCRNRWENHSNPQLNKSPWTSEEDLRMLECIMENGTRWATVAKKACTGRNEHMIKNRYRSLIKRLKINEKGKTLQQTCLTIIEKAGIRSVKQDDQWSISLEDNQESKQKIEELQVEPYITVLPPAHSEQREVGNKQGLSADEIMQEVYLQEFGENHRYMTSLDDSWLDRIMESQSSVDALDIFCI